MMKLITISVKYLTYSLINRNLLLNGEIETYDIKTKESKISKDEFLPKYELEYALPDVPIKPKLFRHINNDPESE